MQNKRLGWLLILVGVLSFSWLLIVTGAAPDTNNALAAFPEDFQGRYQLAWDDYQTNGLADYFQERALLWTETNKRRNDLAQKLPTVAPAKLQQFQAQVLHLLELNPNDPLSLLLAGDYHYFAHQKQTALWYYQQAQKLAPQSETVNLALADFYLNEWQPERVQELLAGFKSSQISLRMGAASLQSGEYSLALGYLIQATPLPAPMQITRDKDLCKAYLALGENQQANLCIKAEYCQSMISGTLFRELQGWSAWLAHNPKAALNLWQAGKVANNDYKLWASIIDWLQPDSSISTINATRDFHDSDFNAAYKITQGQAVLKEGQWKLAYRDYLSAVHHDHRSLVGFLGVGTVQLLRKDYSAALDLCNQGLAVNRYFGPLLAKRAEVLDKLGRFKEADQDRVDLSQAWDAARESTILQAALFRADSGQSTILVRGETKNLVGLWVSAEGTTWQWYPWWGVPITLTVPLTKGWVVPAGPGLSGEVLYLHSEQEKALVSPMNPPLLQDQEILVQLPFAAKLTVEFRDHQLLKSYVADQLTMEHLIPVQLFPSGRVELQLYYQNEAGLWGTFKCSLDLPELPSKPPIQYTISTETPITNHRWIQLNLTMVGGVADDIKVSLGEAGVMSEWLRFQPVVDYQLSAGDGLKTVVARFQDQTGAIQEVSLPVNMDTLAPSITQLENNQIDPEGRQVTWRTSEAVTSWLRVLTDQGLWSEIPVTADANGIFTEDIPIHTIVFCQIGLKDQAGNVTITDNEELNALLNETISAVFVINDGQKLSNSRWVQIKPTGVVTNITWAVSNDLQVWSAWQQGDTQLKWRVNSGEGEQLMVIKYQIAGKTTQFQVIPVIINTIPPRIQEAIPQSTKEKLTE